MEGMKLKELRIERQGWGEFQGQLIGKIVYDSPVSAVAVNINQATAVRLLEIVAEGLVDAAKDVASMTAAAIVATIQPQLPAPEKVKEIK